MTQPRAPLSEGDARAALFAGKHGWQLGGLTLAAGLFYMLTVYLGALGASGQVVSHDAVIFHAVGQIAASETPLAAFDDAALAAVTKAEDSDMFGWLYPPAMMFAVIPLGWVSANTALVLLNLLSAGLYTLALRAFAPWPLALTVAFAPACWGVFMLGQLTLFWAAGLVMALAALARGAQGRAGVWIAALTLKPSLGVMIPFALLGARAWRAIAVASLGALLLAALPTLVLGLDYWAELAGAMGRQAARLRLNFDQVTMMGSVFAALGGLGVAQPVASAVQGAVTLGAAGLVLWVWSRRWASFDLQAAVLCLCIMLATPYLWHYDTAFLSLATLFLWRAGAVRGRGVLWLLPAWLGMMPWFTPALMASETHAYIRFTAPALVLALLGLALLHLKREVRSRLPQG